MLVCPQSLPVTRSCSQLLFHGMHVVASHARGVQQPLCVTFSIHFRSLLQDAPANAGRAQFASTTAQLSPLTPQYQTHGGREQYGAQVRHDTWPSKTSLKHQTLSCLRPCLLPSDLLPTLNWRTGKAGPCARSVCNCLAVWRDHPCSPTRVCMRPAHSLHGTGASKTGMQNEATGTRLWGLRAPPSPSSASRTMCDTRPCPAAAHTKH